MPTRGKRSDRVSVWDGGHWCTDQRISLGKAILKKDETSWVKSK